jgi:NCAIR mutase (PurE)-related protein
VTANEAKRLLEKFRDGKTSLAKTLQAFQAAPFKDINFAKVDTHRGLRNGFPEVVFGLGKTTTHVVRIAEQLNRREKRFLITRVTAETAKLVKRRVKDAVYHETARAIVVEKVPVPRRAGTVAVLCAGTSDLPVAEEAAVTAEVMGNNVQRIYDVGVAGLHRLLGQIDAIQSASVLIVVAGMEGALPSVVAGLVSRPVIAVPTSIGYGANFGGLAALLTMLNSCGSGVTVVNIDNGFGAGYAASQINALADDAR